MSAAKELSSLRTVKSFIEDINAIRTVKDREAVIQSIYEACMLESISPEEARMLMKTVQKVTPDSMRTKGEDDLIPDPCPASQRKRRERESGGMKDFYSVHSLADYFGYNPVTVSRKVREMRKHPERYSRDDIFTSGKYTYVKSDAFVDWLRWGDDIENGFKDIPAYNPEGRDGGYQGQIHEVG